MIIWDQLFLFIVIRHSTMAKSKRRTHARTRKTRRPKNNARKAVVARSKIPLPLRIQYFLAPKRGQRPISDKRQREIGHYLLKEIDVQNSALIAGRTEREKHFAEELASNGALGDKGLQHNRDLILSRVSRLGLEPIQIDPTAKMDETSPVSPFDLDVAESDDLTQYVITLEGKVYEPVWFGHKCVYRLQK